jgi:hypothetical protein
MASLRALGAARPGARAAPPRRAPAAAARRRGAAAAAGPGDLLAGLGRLFSGDSAADADAEDDGGDKFVPLDSEAGGGGVAAAGGEEVAFGPLCVLAAGLAPAQLAALRGLLDELGAEDVPLAAATPAMLDGSLARALAAAAAGFGLVTAAADSEEEEEEDFAPGGVVFLSGMYAGEVVDVVGEVRAVPRLRGVAVAAAVPRAAGKPLASLAAEVAADHATAAAGRRPAAAEPERAAGDED